MFLVSKNLIVFNANVLLFQISLFSCRQKAFQDIHFKKHGIPKSSLCYCKYAYYDTMF